MKKTESQILGLGLVTLTSMVAGNQAQAADLIIDSFDDPVTPRQRVVVDDDPGTPAPPDNFFVEAGSFTTVLGGHRDLSIKTDTSSPNSSTAGYEASSVVVPSQLFWANNSAAKSQLKVVWDGDDDSAGITQNILNQDLSGFEQFDLGIDYADLAGLDITLNVYDGTNSSSINKKLSSVVAAGSSIVESFKFADFTGSANFGKISAIEMILEGPKSIDVTIDFLKVSGSTPPPIRVVPEPTSALAVAGIAALAARRKRKNYSL